MDFLVLSHKLSRLLDSIPLEFHRALVTNGDDRSREYRRVCDQYTKSMSSRSELSDQILAMKEFIGFLEAQPEIAGAKNKPREFFKDIKTTKIEPIDIPDFK